MKMLHKNIIISWFDKQVDHWSGVMIKDKKICYAPMILCIDSSGEHSICAVACDTLSKFLHNLEGRLIQWLKQDEEKEICGVIYYFVISRLEIFEEHNIIKKGIINFHLFTPESSGILLKKKFKVVLLEGIHDALAEITLTPIEEIEIPPNCEILWNNPFLSIQRKRYRIL